MIFFFSSIIFFLKNITLILSMQIVITINHRIMNKSITKILFLISTTRINSKGFVPLYCRITYNQQRKQFTTGLFVNLFNLKK
jgi:hypothetical protein